VRIWNCSRTPRWTAIASRRRGRSHAHWLFFGGSVVFAEWTGALYRKIAQPNVTAALAACASNTARPRGVPRSRGPIPVDFAVAASPNFDAAIGGANLTRSPSRSPKLGITKFVDEDFKRYTKFDPFCEVRVCEVRCQIGLAQVCVTALERPNQGCNGRMPVRIHLRSVSGVRSRLLWIK
jgi:hypothetical protein